MASTRVRFTPLVLAGLFTLGCSAVARATTIKAVPVQAPHTIGTGTFTVAVDDGAGGASTNIEVNVHKVRYPAGGTLYTNVYYAHFSFGNGPAHVSVTLKKFAATFTSYTPTLSPTSYGITPNKSGNVVSFTLSQSRYMMLKIDDTSKAYFDPDSPDKDGPDGRAFYLLIMADDLETGVPVPGAAGVYDVTAAPYNAVGNYTNDETAHIQSAINDASAAGGGTVYVPAGAFKTTAPLRCKSNVNLYLAAGAVIRADPTWTATGTTYLLTANSASTSSVVSNVKIFGRGTLDCNGVDVGGNQTTKGAANPLIAAMQIKDAHDITVDGIVVRESLAWTFYINRCDHITQKNVKVINWNGDYDNYRENDGMNLIQCQNSTVTHCLIWTCDDGACLKGAYDSGDGQFGNSTPLELVQNCFYRDLVIWTSGGGVKFGNQAYTDFTNSYFQDIDIVHGKWAVRIEPWRGSGQLWDNIGFMDVRCERISRTTATSSLPSYPVDFSSKQLYGAATDQGYNAVTDIAVTNFTCANWGDTATGTRGGTVTGIFKDSTHIGTLDRVTFVNTKIAGITATSASSVELVTNAYATHITFPTDTNKIPLLSATSRSTNWYTTGSFSYASLTDGPGNTTTEAQVNDTLDAWVVYALGATRTLDSAKIYQDNGTFSAESWKLEYYDPATSTWNVAFDFTACPIANYNTVTFPPANASQVKITFHPASGKKVGVQDVQVFGH